MTIALADDAIAKDFKLGSLSKFKFAHKFPRTHGEDSEYHAVDEWIRAYKPNPDDDELTIPIQRPFWR